MLPFCYFVVSPHRKFFRFLPARILLTACSWPALNASKPNFFSPFMTKSGVPVNND